MTIFVTDPTGASVQLSEKPLAQGGEPPSIPLRKSRRLW